MGTCGVKAFSPNIFKNSCCTTSCAEAWSRPHEQAYAASAAPCVWYRDFASSGLRLVGGKNFLGNAFGFNYMTHELGSFV